MNISFDLGAPTAAAARKERLVDVGVDITMDEQLPATSLSHLSPRLARSLQFRRGLNGISPTAERADEHMG
ncbi:hypothetical protein C0989_007694, partial [Termitomyces sp. Mn162]